MTEFARKLTEEIAPKLATASMSCWIGGGRTEPMYYDPNDPDKTEYTAQQVWEKLTPEEQDKLRDYAYCCFYHMASYGWQAVMVGAFEEYIEQEGK